jgi:hypothetical protein
MAALLRTEVKLEASHGGVLLAGLIDIKATPGNSIATPILNPTPVYHVMPVYSSNVTRELTILQSIQQTC